MVKVEDNEVFIVTTDTLIGLAGKVNPIVFQKIFELKKRSLNKKLVIAIGSIDQLERMENLQDFHYDYINKYWPGSTTLIINDTAYRIPNQNGLLDLLIDQGPFYLTSANLSNCSTIKTIEEARNTFPNLRVFDFGLGSNQPSIIIDTSTGKRLR